MNYTKNSNIKRMLDTPIRGWIVKLKEPLKKGFQMDKKFHELETLNMV